MTLAKPSLRQVWRSAMLKILASRRKSWNHCVLVSSESDRSGKRHLEEYAHLDGVEIVAAADIDIAELNRVGDLHNIPHRYENFRDLLKHDEISGGGCLRS
jgi:hypothetical protein